MIYKLAFIAISFAIGNQESLYSMRVPGLDDPIQLESKEAYSLEKKLIDNFKKLPKYKPLRLLDMDPNDPLYSIEVTRQILY
jgi:hypothetical protein